jgi:hypothetical protein
LEFQLQQRVPGVTARDQPGNQDLTSRITYTVARFDPQTNCSTHTYTVTDDAGNIGSKDILVCLEIEDVHDALATAKRLEAYYHGIVSFSSDRYSLLVTFGYILLLVVAFVFLWEFGYKIVALFKVLCAPVFGSPTFSDKDIAYSTLYGFIHPFASKTYIRQRVVC